MGLYIHCDKTSLANKKNNIPANFDKTKSMFPKKCKDQNDCTSLFHAIRAMHRLLRKYSIGVLSTCTQELDGLAINKVDTLQSDLPYYAGVMAG